VRSVNAREGYVKPSGIWGDVMGTVRAFPGAARHDVAAAVSTSSAFVKNHVSFSAGFGDGSHYWGILFQNGQFYSQRGNGDMLGASASGSITTGPPTSSSNEIGAGGFTFDAGPGGSRSAGWGPGYMFGREKITTGPGF